MAGYTRQSTYTDGDIIQSADSNDEFDQVLAAFVNTTGHKHDGTTAEGPVIGLIGDPGVATPINKVVVDDTNNRIGAFVDVGGSSVEQLRIQDGVVVPVTDNDIDLGTSSLKFKDLYIDGLAYVDGFGSDILTATDKKIQFRDTGIFLNSSTDGQLDVAADGEVQIVSPIVDINASTGLALDGANLNSAWTVNAANKIQFRDTGIYLNSSADGQLDIVADTEVQIVATTIDINGAADISGNLGVGGNLTVTGTTTFNGGTITMGDAATDNVVFGADIDSHIIPDDDGTYDLGSASQEWRNLYIDGTAHIDTLDVDVNATVAGTLGVTGVLTGSSLDISGDVDIDGTTNLDVVDIDGAVQLDATLTVGADDQGYDVILYGDTASANLTWDTSADDLIFNGAAGLVVPVGQLTLGSTAVTTTAAELNIIDGGTSASSVTVADADRVVLNDAGTMKQVAVTDLAAYFDDEITAMPNLITTAATTVGALNSGSIATGFGNIDNGASTITTTGLISGGSLDIDNVLINGTTIGHTDDTDLITLANGLVTVAGEVSLTTLDIGGTNVTATAAELNLVDGGTARGTTAVATGDGILINDGGTMRMTNVDTVSTYFSSHNVGGTNIVTTGALNAGSITSGFGTIDNGASNITTTGVGAFGSLDISGAIDVDGTTNLDVVDIDGAVDMASTLLVTGVATLTAKPIANAGMSVKNGATGAGFIEFFEDSDNGSNKVTLIGPASTADVTLTLPSAAGIVATTDDATALAIALG